MSHRAWAVAGLALLAGCSSLRPPPVAEATHGGHAVGVTTLQVDDDKRDRHFPLEVWYPARAAPADEELESYFFAYRAGAAVRDAPLLNGGKLPLVLLSHGSGGTRFDLAWLAEALARDGFVVAALEHPGNRYGDEDPYTSLQIWLRPQDVSSALDVILGFERFGERIDERRIGAAGHSLGGYTVLALAGARYDVHRVRRHCAGPRRDPPCWLAPDVDRSRIDYGPSGSSYRDERIQAVMAFAPAVGPGLDPGSAREVKIPVHIVAGREDQLTPFELHGRAWATSLGAELTVLGHGDHYTFVSPCWPGFGLWPWANVCRDPAKLDRMAVQRRLARLASSFFRAGLRGP